MTDKITNQQLITVGKYLNLATIHYSLTTNLIGQLANQSIGESTQGGVLK